MKKVLIFLFASIMLLALTACSSSEETEESKPKEDAAPTVQLLNLDNELFDTANVEKPILYSFWASWCNYCQDEIPHIDELYAKYGDQVEFVSVNITYNDTLSDAKKFISERDIQMPVYFDIDSIASTKFGVLAVPTVILVDRDGQIVQKKVGPSDADSIQDISKDVEKVIDDKI